MSSASIPTALRSPLRSIDKGRMKLNRTVKKTTSETIDLIRAREALLAPIQLDVPNARRAHIGLQFRQGALIALQIAVFVGLLAAVLFIFAKLFRF